MEAIVKKSLRILADAPKVLNLWHAQTRTLFDVIAANLALALDFLNAATVESSPATATTMLPQWYEDLGLFYDTAEPIDRRRERANTIYTSIGAQNPTYLRTQLQKEFQTVDFVERQKPGSYYYGEDNPLYYTVTGTLEREEEYDKMQTLIQKLFPLHLDYTPPVVEVEETVTSARTGVARVGVALTGKDVGLEA